jgi:hypothetical protein
VHDLTARAEEADQGLGDVIGCFQERAASVGIVADVIHQAGGLQPKKLFNRPQYIIVFRKLFEDDIEVVLDPGRMRYVRCDKSFKAALPVWVSTTTEIDNANVGHC